MEGVEPENNTENNAQAAANAASGTQMPATARRSLDDLIAAGSLPAGTADLLRDAMADGRNVLVSGATHAGKTTFLAALIGEDEAYTLAYTVIGVIGLVGAIIPIITKTPAARREVDATA